MCQLSISNQHQSTMPRYIIQYISIYIIYNCIKHINNIKTSREDSNAHRYVNTVTALYHISLQYKKIFYQHRNPSCHLTKLYTKTIDSLQNTCHETIIKSLFIKQVFTLTDDLISAHYTTSITPV